MRSACALRARSDGRPAFASPLVQVHCDGALFAMMMPFVEYAPEMSFRKPVDSIAVSGHKMLGCPMPCDPTPHTQ